MRPVKPTILVVESDDDVRSVAATVLHEYGFAVLTTARGDEALRILEGDFLRIDLLFTDLMPPGDLDGFALARKAKALHPDLQVVLASGYVDPKHSKAIAEASLPVLTKPYGCNELFDAISNELSKSPIWEQVASQARQIAQKQSERQKLRRDIAQQAKLRLDTEDGTE